MKDDRKYWHNCESTSGQVVKRGTHYSTVRRKIVLITTIVQRNDDLHVCDSRVLQHCEIVADKSSKKGEHATSWDRVNIFMSVWSLKMAESSVKHTVEVNTLPENCETCVLCLLSAVTDVEKKHCHNFLPLISPLQGPYKGRCHCSQPKPDSLCFFALSRIFFLFSLPSQDMRESELGKLLKPTEHLD